MKNLFTGLLILISYCLSYSQPQKFNYSVEIPAAFELANVLVALTDFGEADDNIVNKNTAYHDSVIMWFSPYRNHALIKNLNELFNKSKWENYKNYNFFRTGSWFYVIEDGRLVKKKEKYPKKLFANYEGQINDFIATSNYMAFYKAHSANFQNYISRYKEYMPLKEMVEWLNHQFPSRYNNYHIVMSPLIYGYHNTRRYENSNGDKITFMAINIPHQILGDKTISSFDVGQMIRTVFTEIDHNYVNPVSDNYKRKIKRSIKNIECWNNGSQNYSSAYLTFNEYMTWAVYSVFIREYFDKPTFEKLNKSVANMMQNYRGFIKFHAFNDHLLSLSEKKDSDQKLEELVPVMLDWMRGQKCE